MGPWLPWPPGDGQNAQTVRYGPAHAEKGPGGKSRAIVGKLPSAAKAGGRAPQTGGQVMLVECGPDRGGPHRRAGPGAHLGTYRSPGLPMAPGSGRPLRLVGPSCKGPTIPQRSPHQQPKHPPTLRSSSPKSQKITSHKRSPRRTQDHSRRRAGFGGPAGRQGAPPVSMTVGRMDDDRERGLDQDHP